MLSKYIEDLLLCCHNTIFEFKNVTNEQICELPMNITSTLNNCISELTLLFFIKILERAALFNNYKIASDRRYIDDTSFVNKIEAKQICTILDENHPNIKLEAQYVEKNFSISLLDFKITITDNGYTPWKNAISRRTQFSRFLPSPAITAIFAFLENAIVIFAMFKIALAIFAFSFTNFSLFIIFLLTNLIFSQISI